MFKLQKIITNTKHSFEIIDSFLGYYTKNEEFIIYDVLNNKNILVFNDKLSRIGIINNTFFYIKNSFSNIINPDNPVKEERDFKIERSNNDYIVVSYITENREKYIALLNYEYNVVWEKQIAKGKHLSIYDEKVIVSKYLDDSNFQCFDIDGQLLWEYRLTSLPPIPKTDIYNKEKDWEVKKFIGVLNNNLWVALNHHTVIAIDIETGELRHQISKEDYPADIWLPPAIPETEAITVDEENNLLIGFFASFYWEINPKTGEIKLYDLSKHFESKRISNSRPNYILENDQIIFISRNKSKVGILDRKTKTIIWEYEFEKQGELNEIPLIKEIKGNGEMFGALDLAGTLHFFKKE